MTILSRREVVRLCSPLLVSFFRGGKAAASATVATLKVTLAKEFVNAGRCRVSPDGTRLCMEQWKEQGGPWQVVQAGTWQVLYRDTFKQRPLSVGFFGDSQALLLQFVGPKGQRREVVVDIRTGERVERLRPYDSDHPSEQVPTDDRVLLTAHFGAETWRFESLARVQFPGYRELSRTAFLPKAGDSAPCSDLSLSDDRRTVLYFSDCALTCRRTEDLGVIWAHSIEAGLRAFPLAVSAHGDCAAAVIARGSSDGKFEHYERLYTSIFDGRTGAETVRLTAYGKYGIAISPDGKSIAVVADEPGDKGAVLPTAHIHDVPSGNRLASVIHDRIPKGRRQALLAGCTVAFTSDGKYMITSGMTTKVWKLGD